LICYAALYKTHSDGLKSVKYKSLLPLIRCQCEMFCWSVQCRAEEPSPEWESDFKSWRR